MNNTEKCKIAWNYLQRTCLDKVKIGNESCDILITYCNKVKFILVMQSWYKTWKSI